MAARGLAAAKVRPPCAEDPTPDCSTLREVGMPRTVVWVGVRLDFRMPFDGDASCRPKCPEQGASAIVQLVGIGAEDPASQADLMEITSHYPLWRLLWVASLRPLPYGVPDMAVHLGEGFLRNNVAVVVSPACYHRIEGVDQLMLRR